MQTSTFTQNQTQQILRLFSKMMTSGWWHRLITRLTHRSPNLLELNERLCCSQVENCHYAGLHTVDIDSIRGSEGKSDAFDDAFHPLREKSRDRWFGVARERLNGQPLPPVELIDVEGTYYVRDGHHRISVARCLGETYIDAEVIVMDLNRRIR